jgi:single-strand DNA-binding protein
MDLNRVFIIGNVGKEPELRFTPAGKAVANFSVATNLKTADKEITEWFTVVCWDKLAESCNQFVTKGMKVFIEGRLQTRSWEKDGEKKYKTEVIAKDVIFLSKVNQTTQEDNVPPEDDGSIPF